VGQESGISVLYAEQLSTLHKTCVLFQIFLCATAACAFPKPGVLATGAIGYAVPSIAAPALAAPVAAGAPLAYTASAVAAPAVAAPLAYTASAVAAPLAYTAPAVAAPVAYAAPAVAAPAVAAPLSVKTQYHAQDVLGQASYGHAEPFQTHNAIQVRTPSSHSFLHSQGHGRFLIHQLLINSTV
jgi:hypothetical protein